MISRSLKRSPLILPGERALHIIDGFAVRFGVRIDEIIQRIPCLQGYQLQVPAPRELDAILIVGAAKKYSRRDGSLPASEASTGIQPIPFA